MEALKKMDSFDKQMEMVPEMAIRLFSRTTVETVVLLRRKKVDGYIDVNLETNGSHRMNYHLLEIHIIM